MRWKSLRVCELTGFANLFAYEKEMLINYQKLILGSLKYNVYICKTLTNKKY